MLKPFPSIASLSLALALGAPPAVFERSSSFLAQLPTFQPPPPGLSNGNDDAPLCYIRISGSTVNLHHLCGTPPNQAPKATVPGSPKLSNRSNSSSSTQGAGQRDPVSFGTGSAYADDRR